MSTTDLSTGDSGVSLQRLTGQDNYHQWIRDFRVVADLKGVWKFYTGEEKVLPKPDRDEYIPKTRTTRSADAQIIAAGEGNDINTKIAEYKLDLEEYRYNESKVRLAMSLLAFWVDPAIRGTLQKHDNPKAMAEHLQLQYRMTNARALDIALSKMERLKLQDCKSMQEYLNQHEMFRLDIKEAGGKYDESQLISKILRTLPPKYNTFVDQYYLMEKDDEKASLRSITSRLLTFESKLQERADQKRTAINAKDSRTYNSAKESADEGGNAKKPRPKCTYEPCGKWGHTDTDCRMKKSHASGDGKKGSDNKGEKAEGRRQIAAIAKGIDMNAIRQAIDRPSIAHTNRFSVLTTLGEHLQTDHASGGSDNAASSTAGPQGL